MLKIKNVFANRCPKCVWLLPTVPFFSGSVIKGVTECKKQKKSLQEHNQSDSFVPYFHMKLKQTKKIDSVCILNNAGVSLGGDLKRRDYLSLLAFKLSISNYFSNYIY